MANGSYEIVDGPPDAETLLRLRGAAGLTTYPLAQAERGVANSVFGVTARASGETVGIGRIIGDGGFFFDVVDVAVHPDHQGRGVGALIMARLVAFIEAELPETSFVSLHADKGASGLYEKFGFRSRGPEQPGMAYQRAVGARHG